MRSTSLLVIGAGPYGLSVAANAADHGIDTVVVGRPMEFWREHMPARMFLRSGPDWHLDAAGVDTFQAFLEERGIATEDVDPIPVALFVEHGEWFRTRKRIDAGSDLVVQITKPDGRFEAVLESGGRILAQAVVAAPGIANFQNLPPWAVQIPPGRASHTCDHVRFDDLSGARVLIVGGRQSAYEWAALIAEAGAARIDVVHRHAMPAFERVSWKFVDAHIHDTLQTRGWWRNLSKDEQDAIGRHFWEVGRLTLEWWLTPRLATDRIHRWPETEVAGVEWDAGGADDGRAGSVTLSNGERLAVDHVVFATGYKADLANVPYLQGVLDRIETRDGFPVLDESFGTSLDGLYIPGFAATRDFGPFFGFVRGSPAAATIIVDDLLSRGRRSLAGR